MATVKTANLRAEDISTVAACRVHKTHKHGLKDNRHPVHCQHDRMLGSAVTLTDGDRCLLSNDSCYKKLVLLPGKKS